MNNNKILKISKIQNVNITRSNKQKSKNSRHEYAFESCISKSRDYNYDSKTEKEQLVKNQLHNNKKNFRKQKNIFIGIWYRLLFCIVTANLIKTVSCQNTFTPGNSFVSYYRSGSGYIISVGLAFNLDVCTALLDSLSETQTMTQVAQDLSAVAYSKIQPYFAYGTGMSLGGGTVYTPLYAHFGVISNVFVSTYSGVMVQNAAFNLAEAYGITTVRNGRPISKRLELTNSRDKYDLFEDYGLISNENIGNGKSIIMIDYVKNLVNANNKIKNVEVTINSGKIKRAGYCANYNNVSYKCINWNNNINTGDCSKYFGCKEGVLEGQQGYCY